MQLHEHTLYFPRRPKLSIVPLGDWHIGSKACSLDKLKDLLIWIKKTPNVYIIGLGDYCDAINLSDPRFSPDQISDKYKDRKDYLNRMVQMQAEEIIDLLKPIKSRIIGLGVGNHEMTVTKHYHYDIMYRICGALDVKYLGWSSLTRLRLVRKRKDAPAASHVINIFSEHSRSGGRKKGSKVNALEDRSNDIEADIYLRGHSHDKLATTKVQLYLPKNGELKLGVKKRVYAICPSFFNSYLVDGITYGEVAGYPPTSTGTVTIDIEIKSDNKVHYGITQ